MQAFLAEGTAANGSAGDLMPTTRHQLVLVCCGEGSMLHGSVNTNAHLQFFLSSFF